MPADREAEAPLESRGAKNPGGVLDEGQGVEDAQYPFLDVALAPEEIDQLPVITSYSIHYTKLYDLQGRPGEDAEGGGGRYLRGPALHGGRHRLSSRPAEGGGGDPVRPASTGILV